MHGSPSVGRGGRATTTETVEGETHRRLEHAPKRLVVALEATLSMQGNQTVKRRPEGHSGKEGVEVRAEDAGVDALAHAIDEENQVRERWFRGKRSAVMGTRAKKSNS